MRRTPIAWKYFNTLKIVAINWPNCKAWSTGILNTGNDYIKTEQIEYLREPRIMSWTSSVSLEQVKVKNEISLELRCVYVASCRPEFESQANHPCFLSFLVKIELFKCRCGVKRTKINRKRPYLAHIKMIIRIFTEMSKQPILNVCRAVWPDVGVRKLPNCFQKWS